MSMDEKPQNRVCLAALEAILLLLIEKRVVGSDEVLLALEDVAAALREEPVRPAEMQALTAMLRSVATLRRR